MDDGIKGALVLFAIAALILIIDRAYVWARNGVEPATWDEHVGDALVLGNDIDVDDLEAEWMRLNEQTEQVEFLERGDR